MLFKSLLKHKILKNIESRCDKLEKELKFLNEQCDQLQRIIKHYIPGTITGYSETMFVYGLTGRRETAKMYLYKNGEEHVFEGLNIDSPKFLQGEKENIVYAEDGKTGKIYVLDIRSGKSIEIRCESDKVRA